MTQPTVKLQDTADMKKAISELKRSAIKQKEIRGRHLAIDKDYELNMEDLIKILDSIGISIKYEYDEWIAPNLKQLNIIVDIS